MVVGKSELLTIFLEEARGYLEHLRLFVADPIGEAARADAILSDLENLKGVSSLVGLNAPQRIAEHLIEILNDPETSSGEPFANAAHPLLDGLGDMLGAIADGRPDELDVILDKAESRLLTHGVHGGMPTDFSAELIEIFLNEGSEASRGMESALSNLRVDPGNMIERNTFFRHLINLKGAAAMVNQHELTEVLDTMRDVFEAVEAERLEVDATVTDFFITGIQTIIRLLTDLRKHRQPSRETLLAFRTLAREHFSAILAARDNEPQLISRPDFDPAAFDEEMLARELRKTFLAEAQEHLSDLRQLILDAQSESPEADLAQRMFRVAHTLKGAAATAGMPVLSESAHQLENVLDAWRHADRPPTDSLVNLLYESERLFSRMVEEAEEGDINPAHSERLRQAVQRFFAADPDAPAVPEPKTEMADGGDLDDRSPDAPRRTVRVPIERLDSLINLVSELNAYRMRLEDITSEFVAAGKRLKWERRNLNKFIGDFQRKYQWELPVPGLPSPEGSEFSDLEFDRYSDLNIFTRNMEEMEFKISGIMENLEQQIGRFSEDNHSMGALVNELKEEVVQVRMVPVQSLFKRIEFQTQHLARSLGKKVRMVTHGGQTEIDKSLNEGLADPLLHLVRNCLDHGLETPDERRAAGKPIEGLLTVSATQEERSVVIRIEDDGRGVDIDRLAAAAVEQGLFSAEELTHKSREELLELIYHPRISTRATVDEVSGRGVGMDVVRHRLSEMYGSISIDSVVGRGTRFTITVPLTLAVQPILSVTADPHLFSLPMHYVQRLLEADELEALLTGSHDSIRLDDETIPVRWLAGFLGLDHDLEISSHPAVMLTNGDRRMVLVIDSVTSREEAIVRPLSPLVDACSHFMGSTVSPQGDVRLVLNIPFMFEVNADLPSHNAPRFMPRERVKVLIADDSLSVRQTIKFLLTKRGIKANTAKDGLVAWQKMHNIRPDLIMVDLEMPNLNGYELMERVRQSPEFANLPMLVLTSRGGAKHHQKAMASGADGFLTKPALERELMSRIRASLPAHLRDLLDERDPQLRG